MMVLHVTAGIAILACAVAIAVAPSAPADDEPGCLSRSCRSDDAAQRLTRPARRYPAASTRALTNPADPGDERAGLRPPLHRDRI